MILLRDLEPGTPQWYRMKRRNRLRRNPSLAPHGTTSTYTNWSCRCAPCTRANTEYFRELRLSRVNSG